MVSLSAGGFKLASHHLASFYLVGNQCSMLRFQGELLTLKNKKVRAKPILFSSDYLVDFHLINLELSYVITGLQVWYVRVFRQKKSDPGSLRIPKTRVCQNKSRIPKSLRIPRIPKTRVLKKKPNTESLRIPTGYLRIP